MKATTLLSRIYIIGVAALAAACARTADSWQLTGTLPASEGAMFVEAPAAGGRWYVVDSITAPGDFAITAPRMPHSSILRLRTDGGHVTYFPVDSTESLVFNSADFTVGGTDGADLFAKVEAVIRSGAPDMKSELLRLLSGHYADHAAYYVVSKRMADGSRLIDPVGSDADFKLLRAVANSFNGLRPDDPRTSRLVREYMDAEAARRAAAGEEAPLYYAETVGYYDMTFPDERGNDRSLSAAVDSNKVVVLSFMDFTDANVGLMNATIGTAYQHYAPKGLEVYQIGFAENAHLWSNVARNLPWITVYQSEAAPVTNLRQYGIQGCPTTFIIADGELRERVDDLGRLSEVLKPYF
ncbi:MAG: hypothetical protein K2M97_02530 [Muribaculaceae bacterium]|nr:hypothetical protein [Muribaculaceae bacterium]